MESAELQHYGVKGMRWGVRRYQNKDGTLTPAGEKRRKILDDAAKRASDLRRTASSYQMISEAAAARAANRTITDDMVKKYLKDQFGNDMNTKAGRDYIKDVFEIDDLDKYARKELASEADHHRKQVEVYRRAGEHYLRMEKRFSSMSVADARRSDLKKAKRYMNQYFGTLNERNIDWYIKYQNDHFAIGGE